MDGSGAEVWYCWTMCAPDDGPVCVRLGMGCGVGMQRGDTPFSIAITLGYEKILNGLLRAGAGEKVRSWTCLGSVSGHVGPTGHLHAFITVSSCD
jgi:hypothetical protein